MDYLSTPVPQGFLPPFRTTDVPENQSQSHANAASGPAISRASSGEPGAW